MIRKQSGFTLVEIAIVLVIIGLLLGGILKGQELISSARVRNIADTNAGVQAAYYGFIDRYRQVPGDMTAAAATTAIGVAVVNPIAGTATTGNGRIDAGSWVEASAMWEQLSKANFIQGSYTGGATTDTAYRVPTMAPLNPFSGYMLLARSQDYSGWSSSARVPPATGTTPVRLGLVIGDNVPVNIARELDVKIDDQLPLTGALRYTTDGTSAVSFSGISEGTSGAVGATGCVTAANTNTWNVAGQAQNCNLFYVY